MAFLSFKSMKQAKIEFFQLFVAKDGEFQDSQNCSDILNIAAL